MLRVVIYRFLFIRILLLFVAGGKVVSGSPDAASKSTGGKASSSDGSEGLEKRPFTGRMCVS